MKKRFWNRICAPVLCAVLLTTGPAMAMASDFTAAETVGQREIIAENEPEETPTVSVSAENFPDQRFRKWISANIDKNHDGILEQKEILSVTQMDISGQTIVNVQGLNRFTNLQSLDCSDNRLSELDVRNLANLKKLDCSGNTLTSLNLTGLGNLTELACTGGKLGALDLRSNKKLVSVQVCDCGLSSLKVKGLTMLKELDYRFNSISNVDTTGCAALKNTRFAPQSSYTVDVGASWEAGFSKLRNFQNQLAPGDVIQNLDNLEYGKDKDSFVFNSKGRKSSKGSFSIYNKKTGRRLGICTLYAVSVISGTDAPKPPKLIKAVSGVGVRIYWKKTDDATGYKVLRKRKDVKDAKWETVAVLNSAYNSYKDTTGLIGAEYLYTVRAYVFRDGKNYYSTFDKQGVSGKASLKVPVISSAKSGKTPEIKWKAVTGAHGYRIYRRAKGTSKWTQIANVGKTQTTFVDTKATGGTWYQYAVRPYRKIDKTYSMTKEYAVTKFLKCTAVKK